MTYFLCIMQEKKQEALNTMVMSPIQDQFSGFRLIRDHYWYLLNDPFALVKQKFWELRNVYKVFKVTKCPLDTLDEKRFIEKLFQNKDNNLDF